MSKDSDITAFSSLPPKVQQISSALKRWGNIGFWLQLVLGVISAVTLLFASPILIQGRERTQGSEFGIFCAICGLVTLAMGIYFSFRYKNLGEQIQNQDAARRPKKSDTLQIIRFGLMVNLVGMLLAIIGAQALVGIVLAKSLERPQLALGSDPTEFVNSIDLLIVQANTNTIAAHFGGMISSLWLLNRITK